MTLSMEEYVYTQPPPGSYDGSFPSTPTRTVTVVLTQKGSPFGFGSPYFEGSLYEGGIEKGSFTMGWVSPYFRKATLEIATLQGAVAPAPVGAEDFHSVFETAGWDVNAVLNPNPLSVPGGVNPNACWSSADLHNLMTSTVHTSDTHLDTVWHLHVLVVPAAMGCGRGIMFDTINVPREGVASFCDDGYPTSQSANFGTAANQKQRDVPRAFLRSACHEVGHGFNQQHQEITSFGEPGADNSIMTTTPSVADVLGGPPGVFPDNINLGFNDHVRHHLIHFPDPAVRPGGMTFGTGHSSTVPQSDLDRYFFTPDEMELSVQAMKNRIKIGEPCEVDLELTNKSNVDIPTPTDIGTEAQHTYITIENPHGDLRLMKSFVIQTDNVTIEPLKPGGKIKAHATIFWSSQGFAFEIPGNHTIEVKTIWNYQGFQCGVKATTDVWLDFPTSDKDNETASLLLHQDVGKFVALGGAPHLDEAVSRIDKAKAINPEHPGYKSMSKLHNRKYSGERKK